MTWLKPAVGISMFLVFMGFALTSGNLAAFIDEDRLQDHDLEEEDLRFEPDIPAPAEIQFDIWEDRVDSENVTVSNTENLNDTEFGTDTAVHLEENKTDGYIAYEVPQDAEAFTTFVTRFTFLGLTSTMTLEGYDTPNYNDQEPDTEVTISGENALAVDEWQLEQDTHLLVRWTDAEEDHRLYDIDFRDDVERNYYSLLTALLNEVLNVTTSWFKMLGGLPSVFSPVTTLLLIMGTLIVIAILRG